jgi:hypothetical protein
MRIAGPCQNRTINSLVSKVPARNGYMVSKCAFVIVRGTPGLAAELILSMGHC